MSSNPMLNREIEAQTTVIDEPMTISGVINKTAILSLILGASGYYTWNLCANGFSDKASLLYIIGFIAGLILCIITCIKPKVSPMTAPMYALCEGLLLGGLSFSYGSLYSGIVMDAVCITFLVMLSMLFLYKSKLIRATERFRSIIYVSTVAIMVFYLIRLVLALFHFPVVIFNGGLMGIGISLFICVIAALNFIIDFDNICNFEQNLAPKYFEWYFGFSVLVTLVWLYIEVLRLLAQLRNRN